MEVFDQIRAYCLPQPLIKYVFTQKLSSQYQMGMNDKEIFVTVMELLGTPIQPLLNHINECMN